MWPLGNHNTLSVKWNGTCAPWLDSPRLNAHRWHHIT